MNVITRPSAVAGVALAASGLIAVTPAVAPPDLHGVTSADVRLTSGASDALDALLSGLLGGTPVTNLSALTGDLTTINDSLGLTNLLSGIDNVLGDVSKFLTDFNFGNLVDWIPLGGLQNIPYNIITDIFNIPYTESQALQEYAYALGPAGSTGGVAGWIPPGATVPDGGVYVDPATGQEFYTQGGTGSWWMESIGNTWGWDNGNWPQLDAIAHFILPLQWTEGVAQSLQSVAQSSFIDGSHLNCEFQCSDVVGYLGGWLTHLGNVFDSTYPTTITDTIGENSSTGVVNVGPPGTEETAIWSGQHIPINPLLEPFQAIWQNAIESPSSNPIELPSLSNLLLSGELLGYNLLYDFNPIVQGSFLWWGASTLYSIPSLLGGLVHTLSLGLIPNEFILPNNGAEPLSGYTDNITNLLPNLQEGFKFLADGLMKYFDPSTWFAGTNAADAGAAATTGAGALLGSLGDHAGLLSDLSALMPNLGGDLASSLGTGIGGDLATMFPQLSADLGSWFPDLAAALIP